MCHSTIWCNSYNKKGNQWRACVILQKDGLRKKTHFVTEFLSTVKNISKCLQSLEQRHKDSERAEWDGKKLLSLGNKLRPKHHKCRSNGELEVATIEQTGHKSRPFVWSKGFEAIMNMCREFIQTIRAEMGAKKRAQHRKSDYNSKDNNSWRKNGLKKMQQKVCR